MNGQIISYKGGELNWESFMCSKHNSPRSLDTFTVNVIDLTDVEIWKSSSQNYSSINSINDFKSLQLMIEQSKMAANIVILPSNVRFEYNWSAYQKRYTAGIQIKDMLTSFSVDILSKILPSNLQIPLFYENCITQLNSINFDSAFYFDESTFWARGYSVLTRAKDSEKATTVKIDDKFFITTANILQSEEHIVTYLKSIGIWGKEKKEYPDWLLNYDFGDDRLQSQMIDDCRSEIVQAEAKIDAANNKLDENLRFKSILFTNGEELVSVIFEILEQLLTCDLSQFHDEKKEDFLIQLSDVTFIGEIKGVSSNVKSEHVSQVDTHYHGYMDKLHEEGLVENVKELLIINPLRTKSLENREPVHEIQIKLAERNNALIIETKTLLDIFESFQKGELTSEAIKNAFKQNSGILRLDDCQ